MYVQHCIKILTFLSVIKRVYRLSLITTPMRVYRTTFCLPVSYERTSCRKNWLIHRKVSLFVLYLSRSYRKKIKIWFSKLEFRFYCICSIHMTPPSFNTNLIIVFICLWLYAKYKILTPCYMPWFTYSSPPRYLLFNASRTQNYLSSFFSYLSIPSQNSFFFSSVSLFAFP